VLGVQFGSAVTGIKHDLLSAARRSLGFQSLEKNVTAGILVNRHGLYRLRVSAWKYANICKETTSAYDEERRS